MKVPAWLSPSLIVSGVLALWSFVTMGMHVHGYRDSLTISWALLAFVIFGLGLLAKSRIYRWLGLILLAVATVRVVGVDVWKLDKN